MSKLGVLYLIPAPLADETALEVMNDTVKESIKHCDLFLVENVRSARRYISSLRLGLTIESLQFELLNKRTTDKELSVLMKPLLQGKNIGIISEAGCPGIADPGTNAVEWAHNKKVTVAPLVGPSSILMALIASGLNGQKFAFHGYLPIQIPDLIKKIKYLEQESFNNKMAMIFMETPFRNEKLLRVLTESCGAETRLCVAVNITGKDQNIRTESITWWKKNPPSIHKIPTVFVLMKK